MLRRCALLGTLALVVAACGSGSDTAPAQQEPATTAPSSDAHSSAHAARRRGVRLVSIGRFDAPLYVTAPRGDRRRVFVVGQGGRIWVVRGGHRLARPFLDISGRVQAGGEQGLLGLAFAPDYASSGRFYVDYTDHDGNTNIVEYRRANEDRANPSSARRILFQEQPEPNHNGGQLAFGPDGLLYIGFGDGGGANDQHGGRGNAQNLGTWLGKILRIDPLHGDPYDVPSSNPFAGRSGAKPEIYSYGLRNPWRFSFDRSTGALAIGDVGQDAVEEIDFVRRGRGRGADFGWRPFEGRRRNFEEPAPGAIPPVIQQFHDDGNCSITGGYVVRDAASALRGRYVFADYCAGVLKSARLRPGRTASVSKLPVKKLSNVSSFGEDAAGRVYVTSLDGGVYRLD
jgi:glucose/arabinose dehydrogenase